MNAKRFRCSAGKKRELRPDRIGAPRRYVQAPCLTRYFGQCIKILEHIRTDAAKHTACIEERFALNGNDVGKRLRMFSSWLNAKSALQFFGNGLRTIG